MNQATSGTPSQATSEETNGIVSGWKDPLPAALYELEALANAKSSDLADRKDALAAATSIRRMLTRAQKAQIAATRAELKAATKKA